MAKPISPSNGTDQAYSNPASRAVSGEDFLAGERHCAGA